MLGMLGIVMDFDISIRLIFQNPLIIYHHTKKYYLRKTKRTNNKMHGDKTKPVQKRVNSLQTKKK